MSLVGRLVRGLGLLFSTVGLIGSVIALVALLQPDAGQASDDANPFGQPDPLQQRLLTLSVCALVAASGALLLRSSRVVNE